LKSEIPDAKAAEVAQKTQKYEKAKERARGVTPKSKKMFRSKV
jgi:hypothetical protein